ncbi:MAG: cell wall metabolism sensor histidine kinase WalK [Firmicutes bacterium]|jgi:signal transduction histidine kinase|nr:cell wall metabolism sensor histidine kinase WalK [Bacillota bacterium]
MFHFHSIRSRLTVTFLLIIFAVMLIISVFLYNRLESYYRHNLQDNLSRSGFLAADFVIGYLREPPGEIEITLSEMAENFSAQSRARVIFIDQNGIVIGDSVRIGALLGQYLDRAEVEAALQGQVGSSIQFSEKTNQHVMQVAVPVQEEGNPPLGAVFLSASLQDISNILTDVRRFLLGATILAAAVVGGGSVILARRFTEPIELLTTAARHMAEGKLGEQIKVSSRDEIGHLAEQFNVMSARLNYYTGSLKNFVTNVSHELRTPLTSLSLLIKSLKEYQMEPEQQQEFYEDLDREVERLIALVNDLLELTKLEETGVQHEPVALDQLIGDIVKQVSPRFARQGVQLISELPAEPVEISGSPLQLRQVLHNLLDNALKYTPSGGWVRVSAWLEADGVGVSIEDTGCGIPQEDQPYIFERFYRVDRARSREMGGTGLGLAIVKETVTAHGGKVWVESEEGKGSTFYLLFPRLVKEGIIKDY